MIQLTLDNCVQWSLHFSGLPLPPATYKLSPIQTKMICLLLSFLTFLLFFLFCLVPFTTLPLEGFSLIEQFQFCIFSEWKQQQNVWKDEIRRILSFFSQLFSVALFSQIEFCILEDTNAKYFGGFRKLAKIFYSGRCVRCEHTSNIDWIWSLLFRNGMKFEFSKK